MAVVAVIASTAIKASPDKKNTPPTLTADEMSQLTESYGNVMYILQNYFVDTLDIKELAKNGFLGMLGKVDPYTEVYTEDNIDDLRSVVSGDYGGIG